MGTGRVIGAKGGCEKLEVRRGSESGISSGVCIYGAYLLFRVMSITNSLLRIIAVHMR